MMNKNLYLMLLKDVNKNYNSKKVSQYIIRLKFCKNDKGKQEIKLLLFMALSKLFVKAVNNFFSLVESFPSEKVIHTNQDIACECYIIMDRCVENLKVSEVKKFYFYLNTSLNRGIYRLFERNYKKHYDVVSNTADSEALLMNKKHNHHFDMSEIDLRGFSELEVDIINFKISGEKLKVFLKLKKLTDLEYSEMLEHIKFKLIKLYDYEPDN